MQRKQPNKIRNWQAVSAQMRNSAGSMGGSPRANHKRDRSDAKQELQSYKGKYA